MRGDPVAGPVEVFASRQARPCRERALVLVSQSIPFQEIREAGAFRLLVDEPHVGRALEELRRYEEENRHFRLRRALPPAAPLAQAGVAACALVVVLVTLAQWDGFLGLDWLGRGRTEASAIRAGEVWRTATALTLHTGVPHLLSNVVFGSAFAYLLFHAIGGGLGALALVAAGMLGNLANAWFRAGEHLSIGASTAVFGAIGLLAGSEVRARHLLSGPEARRFAPVGGAVLLLLWLGVGDAGGPGNTDVMAHVFGLLAGLPLGFLIGAVPREALESRRTQLALGTAALAVLGACWALALG